MFPIMPAKLVGAKRKGMLFDFSPAIMMVDVVCLADWVMNAEHPARIRGRFSRLI